MTPGRRRWLSAGLGVGLVAALLLLVSLDDQYVAEPPDAVIVREVQLYEAPPPPPPPPVAEPESSAAGPELALANLTNPVELEIMDLNVDLPSGQFGDLGSGFAGLGDGTGAGLDVINFNELDSIPVPVEAPALVYPQEAIDRGIVEFQVFVHLLVDEEGYSFPIGIVENPIPSFSQEVLDYTARIRFTKPTRLGIPVRAEYLLPLLFRRPPSE